MKKLDSAGLRRAYLEFFAAKGHKVIPSASLIPENDPTVLFTTAGMHPLVPYLLGEKHPLGNRLTDVQKCVRTGDIDEVGDKSHCTFFEMLGNWSLGDYFNKESISMSYEFLTKALNIDPKIIAVTVFAGDADAPRDNESAAIWESLGIARERIFYLPKKDNWWGPAGVTGPCGPDTEIFIDKGKPACSDGCNPSCKCGKYLEIWNNVFMQYNKTEDGKYLPLKQKNVDTGMGLERTVGVLNSLESVYDCDLFKPAIELIEQLSNRKYASDAETTRAMRIVADHVRTSTFIIGDGIVPSNVDQGYVLRRLIRRAVRFGRKLDFAPNNLSKIAEAYIGVYGGIYKNLAEKKAAILNEFALEEERFNKTVEQGLKELEKVIFYMKDNKVMNGKTAFRLYDTFGFPIEMTVELCAEKGLSVDVAGYEAAFKEHQLKSQAGAEQKFKGGLADNTEDTAKLHTATHLMHAALIKVLGGKITQRGSNITAERLRFDFEFGRPMTDVEIAEVERLVNEAIDAKVPVICREMPLDEAFAEGAIGVFTDKYGERVKVYTAGVYSKEICGGPHASNTGDLKPFKIVKEQSSSAGVRRIKAVLGGENGQGCND